jgi:hypothetical protein
LNERLRARARKRGDDPVTLRNFGLSFSRRSARPNAGVLWRPRHAVGIGLVLVQIVLAALWAMI